MSAYIVEDKTINDSIAFLKTYTVVESWILKPLNKLGYDLTKKEDRERLAKDLFVLNIDGVEARYGKGQTQQFRPLNFKFVNKASSASRLSIIQCIKSLHCLMYQCSEGNVPERDLFKAMETVIHNLEGHVVACMPEYDKAEWG